MDAGVVGIELEALVEIAAREVGLSLAHVGAAAAGIGGDDFRIAAKGLVVVRDGEIEIAAIAPYADTARDIGPGEVGVAELFRRDQARARGDAVLEVGRARQVAQSTPPSGSKLALDPPYTVVRLPPSPLLLVGIDAQRRAEIGERVVELALGLVDLSARGEGIEVSRRQPD